MGYRGYLARDIEPAFCEYKLSGSLIWKLTST